MHLTFDTCSIPLANTNQFVASSSMFSSYKNNIQNQQTGKVNQKHNDISEIDVCSYNPSSSESYCAWLPKQGKKKEKQMKIKMPFLVLVRTQATGKEEHFWLWLLNSLIRLWLCHTKNALSWLWLLNSLRETEDQFTFVNLPAKW